MSLVAPAPITVGEPPRSALISISRLHSGPVPAFRLGRSETDREEAPPMMQLIVRCSFITNLLFRNTRIRNICISDSKSAISAICPPAPVAAETQPSLKTTKPLSMSTAFFFLHRPSQGQKSNSDAKRRKTLAISQRLDSEDYLGQNQAWDPTEMGKSFPKKSKSARIFLRPICVARSRLPRSAGEFDPASARAPASTPAKARSL